jgi:hypothetical protein
MTETDFESKYINKIICGDCLEVMRDFPDNCVDLVLKKELTKSTKSDNIDDYEQTRKIQTVGSEKAMGATQSRNRMALQAANVVAGQNSKLLQGITDDNNKGFKASGDNLKRQGQKRQIERQVQGRFAERSLSADDRKRQMRKMQLNDASCCSPQERGSSGQSFEKSSSPLRELSQQPVKKAVVGSAKIVCITDPPYGIKVDTSWLTTLHIKRGKPANASDATLLGDDGSLDLSFLWKYKNRIVFGHPYIYDPHATGWLVWDKQPGVARRGITSPVELASTTCWKGFDIIRCMWGGYMREVGEIRYEHPTQKPLSLFLTLVKENSNPNDLILDPFCGSGTTCVAAKMLGRRYIGIDISEEYCEISRKRLRAVETGVPVKEQEIGQLPLFEDDNE